MQNVAFELSMDSYVEEGLLEAEVLIDRVEVEDDHTGEISYRWERVAGAKLGVVGKRYYPVVGVALYLVLTGATIRFVKPGDKLEILKTFVDAHSVAIRIIRDVPEGDPDRFLSMSFKSIHEFGIVRCADLSPRKKTKKK